MKKNKYKVIIPLIIIAAIPALFFIYIFFIGFDCGTSCKPYGFCRCHGIPITLKNTDCLGFKRYIDKCCINCSPIDNDNKENKNMTQAELNKEFKLKINEEIEIKEENIKVKFLDVIEDSRCPSDINCFWQGQAIILVNIYKDNKDLGNFSLITHSENKKSFDQYSIEFTNIDPYPKTTKGIEKSDYIITLVIKKNMSEENENFRIY